MLKNRTHPIRLLQEHTTHSDHAVWQDVYRPSTQAGDVYPKLKAIGDVLIVSSRSADQAVFAAYLNTSTSTVQKWEQGQKRPNGPSLNLEDRKGLDDPA